jgi:hypothetical protein
MYPFMPHNEFHGNTISFKKAPGSENIEEYSGR